MKADRELLTQLNYTYKSITINLKNVSEKEAITWPPSGGNCINWVMGHILYSRKKMQKFLNLSPTSAEKLQAYRRGVNAKSVESEFISLRQLRQMLDNSQKVISEKLEDNYPSGETSKEIARLIFHEAYHAGQIGLLRRVLGKEGQIN